MAERLPMAEEAYAEEAKVAGYLLDPEHPRNGGKARFFSGFGFRAQRWHVLREALLLHARESAVTEGRETPYGIQYAVQGPLVAPDGRAPVGISVWELRTGERAPRLVTAYPGSEESLRRRVR
jgi:hypothetical protein